MRKATFSTTHGSSSSSAGSSATTEKFPTRIAQTASLVDWFKGYPYAVRFGRCHAALHHRDERLRERKRRPRIRARQMGQSVEGLSISAFDVRSARPAAELRHRPRMGRRRTATSRCEESCIRAVSELPRFAASRISPTWLARMKKSQADAGSRKSREADQPDLLAGR